MEKDIRVAFEDFTLLPVMTIFLLLPEASVKTNSFSS